MATLNNAGRFDCLAKLQRNPDMPYFLLLASDPAAPSAIRHWCTRRVEIGKNESGDTKILEALACATAMERWQIEQQANAQPVKSNEQRDG